MAFFHFTRLQNWDYGCNGAYYVTICTKKRKHYFGHIDHRKMKLSDIGEMAHDFWTEIPQHSCFYDHIIRNNQSFNNIRYYIETNVENWFDDPFF